ncbi:uncharacterized protein LOC127734283 [Mytilus californianus]|uniref:uncharacterized protein LOC127734283 n=1 Tax=Mytilus californianus TaxID=6549 RepID=UPI0022464C1D|nr:uncharacterized protein LOC127734283 [Mytilus californianus]
MDWRIFYFKDMQTYWFVFIVSFMCIQNQNCLPCQSDQDNSDYTVNCTATIFAEENCSDSFLSGQYGDLYGQLNWPAKPDDLTLKPIQLEYRNTSLLYPGFLVEIKPPRSGIIKDVKGFQLNYKEEEKNVKKCAIIIFSNASLDHNHRENNLKVVVKLWPLNGGKNFLFTAWSLPKPPEDELDEKQTRYGKTGKYKWRLTDAPADWVTTISYHNDVKNRYIRIWFVHAPDEYSFSEYMVTLEMIISGEDTNKEHRDVIEEHRISKADYTFLNVKQGRYRVFVQAYDDKWDSLNGCRCKSSGGGCFQCVKTMTAVIVVPRSEDVVMTSELQSSTATNSQSQQTEVVTDQTVNHVLPSILGFVAFLLVIIIVIGCYLLHRDRDQPKYQPELPVHTINPNPNNFLTINDRNTSSKYDETSVESAWTVTRNDIEFVPPTENRSEDLSLSNLMDQVHDFDKNFLPGNDNNDISSLGFCQ